MHDRSTDKLQNHRFISLGMYKCLEGAVYSLQYQENLVLSAEIDEIAVTIAYAYTEDKYLYGDHICENPQVIHQGKKLSVMQ